MSNLNLILLEGGKGVTSNLLTSFVNFIGPLIAMGLIFFVCKEAWGIYKGAAGATAKKLAGGIILFFVMIGTIFLAKNYRDLETSSKTTVQKGVEIVNKTATDGVEGNIN